MRSMSARTEGRVQSISFRMRSMAAWLSLISHCPTLHCLRSAASSSGIVSAAKSSRRGARAHPLGHAERSARFEPLDVPGGGDVVRYRSGDPDSAKDCNLVCGIGVEESGRRLTCRERRLLGLCELHILRHIARQRGRQRDLRRRSGHRRDRQHPGRSHTSGQCRRCSDRHGTDDTRSRKPGVRSPSEASCIGSRLRSRMAKVKRKSVFGEHHYALCPERTK